jgi:hypothetical protein
VTPPAAAPAVRARPLAPSRPFVPTRRPRRVSGPVNPARPAPAARPARRAEEGNGGLLLGALDLLRGISRHRLLDRLIRGRAWIALVAFALLGIVTLQLALLKLNTSVGRSLERSALLQRENAALSIENSELTAGGRVETTAARLGMSLIPAGTLKFLTARPLEDPYRASAALSAPVHTLTVSEEAATAAARAESAGATPSGEEGSASGATGASEAAAGAGEAPAGSAAAGTSGEASATPSEASSAASTAPAAGAGETRASAPTTSASGAASSSSGAEAGAGGGTQASPTG